MASMSQYDSSIFKANGAVRFGTIGDLFNSFFSNSLCLSSVKICDEISISREPLSSNFIYTVSVNDIDCLAIDNKNTILSEKDTNVVIVAILEKEKQNSEKKFANFDRTAITEIEAAALMNGVSRLKNGFSKNSTPLKPYPCKICFPLRLSYID
jgi:hypothetical protein